MKIINQARLDQLSREAVESDRLRKNLNLHDDYADPCQRLFNAMEPGTYIRPHRHLDPPKPECFMAVRGRMVLVVFDDHGELEQVVPFGAGCDAVAIELPPGLWHTLLVLEHGSIFFETKPGPYQPLSDKDFAPWSPVEGTAETDEYLTHLMSRVSARLLC
jgi:cupin fold WbuC family metalloprotein